MPMYEYKCGYCDHTYEKLVRLNTPHPRKCPECGSPALKRIPFGSRPPQLHMRYSYMAPRHMRGQRRRKGKGNGK